MSFFRSSDKSPTNKKQDITAHPRHDAVDVIEFVTGQDKIRINRKNTKCYYNHTKYDLAAADNADVWHMVVIHHEGKYSKAQMISRIFAIAENTDCYIVAYRRCAREDYFLVRLCRQLIAKLFYQCLKTKMFDGPFLHFTVKLNVADYKMGQIHHLSSFENAFTERCNSFELFEGVAKVLNLDRFANSPEFTDLIFTLSNKSSLALLCSTLAKHSDIFKLVNGIRLSNNDIQELEPFTLIPSIDIQLIDLRNNKISDVNQLKHLRKINFTELLVQNNPLTSTDGYVAKILELLPNVVKVDRSYTREILPSLIHLDSGEHIIEVIFQGDVIHSSESLPSDLFRKYKTSDMWHQVIVNHKGKYAKIDILSAIFNSIETHEFYPCYYQTGDKSDSFFIRNCFEQMEFLYLEKLKIRMPTTDEIITMTYKMNVANFKKEQIDPAERIQTAIASSFSLMDKRLNLNKFSTKPEFNHIEVMMSVPRMMSNILLQAARKYLGNIEKLILSENNINSSKGMQPLTWMKNLKSIDLSGNKIENLSDIQNFPKIGTINDISLKENPLCAKYQSSPLEYITAVKKIFPGIHSLDRKNLSPDGCCVPQKNYLCSIDGYDLIDQFIRQYFGIYDSVARSTIQGMYKRGAIMSISSNFSGLTSKTTDGRIKMYQSKSRNMLRMSPASAIKTTFYGPDDITGFWKVLPQSVHDFQSFTIDLTYFTSEMSIFKVSGIFKELGTSLNEEELILGFSRTFVLKRDAEGVGFFGNSVQYSIINEQVFFHRPSIYQLKNSFQPLTRMEIDPEDENLSAEEKEGMVVIFQELTCLVPLWCIRCLDQSSWNFKRAIDLFIHLCDENKVPDCAFNFGTNNESVTAL